MSNKGMKLGNTDKKGENGEGGKSEGAKYYAHSRLGCASGNYSAMVGLIFFLKPTIPQWTRCRNLRARRLHHVIYL